MESTDLDMGEIFDDHDEDEDIGAVPELSENTQDASQDNEEAENAEVLARLKDLSKGAAKKVVRRPQPKLDPTRLTGDRGIPILPKLFENVKFKGRGHEASDLAVLMRHMEHWGHRLFPKMPFDEVIERVEKLGSKKPVQTCVKKIRMDMPTLDEDFVGSDQEDGVNRNGDIDELQEARNTEDAWEELLREEEAVRTSQALDSTTRSSKRGEPEARLTSQESNTAPADRSTMIEDRLVGEEIGDEAQFTATKIDTPSVPSQTTVENGGFTPEQLARMERNKQLAMERRLQKMGKMTPKSVAT